MRGKRAACIIVEVRVALIDERLELRNDGVIAAGACDGLAELIVDLAAAVERQNAVVHVLIDVPALVLVEQQAVGGDGEAELLAVLLLDGARVIDRLGNGVPRHERLAAEEVHLDVAALARTRDNEVDRLLRDLGRHDLAALTKVAGGREAVFAAQIAVVRDVQAERLDRCADRNIAADVNVVVLREKLACLFQLVQLAVCLAHVVRRVLRQRLDNALRALLGHVLVDQTGNRIADIVEQMDCAGVDVQDKVQTFFLVTMDHFLLFPPIYIARRAQGAPMLI